MSESDSDDYYYTSDEDEYSIDDTELTFWGWILQFKEIYKATKYSMFWNQYSQDPKDDMFYLKSMIKEDYSYNELFGEYEHSLGLKLRRILSSKQKSMYDQIASATTKNRFNEQLQSALQTYTQSNK